MPAGAAAEQAGRLRQHVDHHHPCRPASGWRAATIIASVPPIEWPTIAGRSQAAVGDVAGDLVGERRDDRARAHCRAPARRRSRRPGPDGSDSRARRATVARQTSRPAVRPGIRITSGPAPRTSTEKRVGAKARRGRGRRGTARQRPAAGQRARARKMPAIHRALLASSSLNLGLPTRGRLDGFVSTALSARPRHALPASLSRRRLELHLPRLSPAAAADQQARAQCRRGLRLHDDALEAGRRASTRRTGRPISRSSSTPRESTFRNQMYDQYKANRPPPPPELVPQFPLIRDATRAFSIPCIEEEGLEADDIIACYAKAALARGLAGHHRLLRQGSDAADRARASTCSTR